MPENFPRGAALPGTRCQLSELGGTHRRAGISDGTRTHPRGHSPSARGRTQPELPQGLGVWRHRWYRDDICARLGVAGAHLSSRVILILGGASLIADGFAMAAGNYLATRAEHEEFRYAEAVGRRHIANAPEGEREEVREILRGLGIVGDLLERGVHAITADRDRWVRVMLRYEYGLPAAVRSPWQAAGSTFSAFLICGLVPLIPFFASIKNAFWVASAVTGVTFVLIGALKAQWSIRPWWHSGFSTLARLSQF